MEGKSKEEILSGYLWALEKMRPTLSTLFKAAIRSQKGLDGLQLRAQKKFNLLQVMGWAATLERAQEIYAASLFLVLDQWIKALGKSLGVKNHRVGFGETIGKVSLTRLILATANNFRHHGGWDKPDDQAKKNIKVLSEAGIHNVRDTIIAYQALLVLRVGTYKELEAKLRDLGHQMLAAAPNH